MTKGNCVEKFSKLFIMRGGKMKKIITVVIILFVCMASCVTFALSDREIIAQLERFNIYINGTKKEFTNPIVSIDDKTYVSIREMAEMLGMEVIWNENEQSVMLKSVDGNEVSLFPFEEQGLWGYMNENEEVIISPQYYEAGEFVEELALVRKSAGQDGAYGYINQKGEEVIPCTYYMAYSFSDGVALVSLATKTDENRWTYIDKQGQQVFDKEFVLAYSFSEGYAAVLKEGSGAPLPASSNQTQQWSYIDKNGNFVTSLVFEEAMPFNDGYAKVKDNGKWGVIDKSFNFLVPCIYDELGHISNGAIEVRKDDLWSTIELD